MSSLALLAHPGTPHRPRVALTYGRALLNARRTRASMRAGDLSSCSHTRSTAQPCLRNAEVTNLSLTLFFASFSSQKVTFVDGAVQ